MLCVRSLSPPIDEYIGRPPAVHETGAKESDEPDKSSVRYDVHLDLDPLQSCMEGFKAQLAL